MTSSCPESVYFVPLILAVCYCALITCILAIVLYKYNYKIMNFIKRTKKNQNSLNNKKTNDKESSKKSKKSVSIIPSNLPITDLSTSEMVKDEKVVVEKNNKENSCGLTNV
ncbi:Hypothetical protein SRAE_1000050900 [Strongyloides ratti]|uniref:Uncharacterized protein n=1 Tax=Strongyloides ratti TaxID=34506 RepID=A0A090KXV8_STRRB|nr:Hypothetical protein SRAE_1000050900 [Strongyloides ratti]CEF62236.1 Hypothetical protein SRAE_1000050900 [Strongyloides ratti]